MQPGAPAVVARAAGERDRGSRAGGGDGDVGADASLMRHERVRFGERGDGTLADEIDDGLAEAEGSHALRLSSAAVPPVTEETIELDDQPVFLRRAGDTGFAGKQATQVPILYLHGLPTSSFDWLGPLELGGGIAVDLPGFGRSGKRGDLDYSLAGHVAFVDRLLEALDVDRVRLCMHDWGAAVGLAWAAAQPERVERLVVIDGVPLLEGFRWRGWARLVGMPLVGPVAVGFATERMVRRLSRRASAGKGPMAKPFVKSVAEHIDLGTERALLKLLRSATPKSLAAAGTGLGDDHGAGARAARRAGPVDRAALRRRLRGDARRRDARDDRGRGPLAMARPARALRAHHRPPRRRASAAVTAAPAPSAVRPAARRRPKPPPPGRRPPAAVTAARWACVVAALGAAAYLLLDPATADHAAQEYRAGLVRDAGLGLWDNGWFAGHHTPAYSLLSPPLGALLGVRLAGALAAVVAAALFGLIAERRWGPRAGSVAAAWFALGLVATLVSGRLTFALGVAIGLAAMLALQRDRWPLACALAALTTLASPVAGLFVAIAAIALALAPRSRASRRSPRATRRAAPQPKRLAADTASARRRGIRRPLPRPSPRSRRRDPRRSPLSRGRDRAVRRVGLLARARRTALVAVALPARERDAADRRRDLRAGAASPRSSSRPRSAATRPGWARCSPGPSSPERSSPRPAAGRSSPRSSCRWPTGSCIPPCATSCARRRPVHRRRLPRPARALPRAPPRRLPRRDPVHREPLGGGARRAARRRSRAAGSASSTAATARCSTTARSTATTYRAWLDEHAVAYVAVPDVPLDYSARGEAKLIAGRPPYLRPVWRGAHWRVFAVRRPAPLVSGAARSIELEPDGFDAARRAPRRRVRARAPHALVGGHRRPGVRRARPGRHDARARAAPRHRARAGPARGLRLPALTATDGDRRSAVRRRRSVVRNHPWVSAR